MRRLMAVAAAPRSLVEVAWPPRLLRAVFLVWRRPFLLSDLVAVDEDLGVAVGSDAAAPTLGLLLGSSCWADGKAEFRFI